MGRVVTYVLSLCYKEGQCLLTNPWGLSPGPPDTSYQKSLGPWIVYNRTGVTYEGRQWTSGTGRNESQECEQRPSQVMSA